MDRFIVNVALNRRHYCKIEIPGSLTESEAKERAMSIRRIFTSMDPAFQVTMSCWRATGREVEF